VSDAIIHLGDRGILEKVSPRLAEVFGLSSQTSSRSQGVIAAAIVQQYHRHADIFDAAIAAGWDDSTDVLVRAAEELGVPLYTLVYGIAPRMVESFTVISHFELNLLIQAGEFETDVLDALLEENDGKPLAAGLFRDSIGQDAYALRAHFCAAFLGVDSSYALLQMGIRPSNDYKDFQKVIDCAILGVPIEYATATKGRIDPPDVVKAYRNGVAIEYLMAVK
jgi:hypothetical protein